MFYTEDDIARHTYYKISPAIQCLHQHSWFTMSSIDTEGVWGIPIPIKHILKLLWNGSYCRKCRKGLFCSRTNGATDSSSRNEVVTRPIRGTLQYTNKKSNGYGCTMYNMLASCIHYHHVRVSHCVHSAQLTVFSHVCTLHVHIILFLLFLTLNTHSTITNVTYQCKQRYLSPCICCGWLVYRVCF